MLHIYIYICIYDISRLRVKIKLNTFCLYPFLLETSHICRIQIEIHDIFFLTHSDIEYFLNLLADIHTDPTERSLKSGDVSKHRNNYTICAELLSR